MATAQSTAPETFTIADVRRSFKQIGYGIRTKRYSEFISATIRTPDGEEINCGSVFTPEAPEKHKQALALRSQFKGKIFDGDWRVVI